MKPTSNDHQDSDISSEQQTTPQNHSFKHSSIRYDLNQHLHQNYPKHQIHERVFMNTLLKHTGIALLIIIPLALYSIFARAENVQAQRLQASEVLPVTPVDQVNLRRYAGQWYEIARLPMFFQRNCASDVTANYSLGGMQSSNDIKQQNKGLQKASRVHVVNTCRKSDGEMMEARGIAKPQNASGSQLKVTFLPKGLRWLPFAQADYWILAIADDYSYAMVGTPNREYLWLLSRTPSMSQSTYDDLLHVAQKQGFDINNLTVTQHESQNHTIISHSD